MLEKIIIEFGKKKAEKNLESFKRRESTEFVRFAVEKIPFASTNMQCNAIRRNLFKKFI